MNIKCGACGTMLDGFKDDCPTCLAKEEALKQPVDKEYELLFPKEQDKRERDEKLVKRKPRNSHDQ